MKETDNYDLMCEIGKIYESWNRDEIKTENVSIKLIRKAIEIYDLKNDMEKERNRT